MALDLQLRAIAITDHDTVAGYLEIQKIRKGDDPEIVPGVELSATVDDDDLLVTRKLIFRRDITALDQAPSLFCSDSKHQSAVPIRQFQKASGCESDYLFQAQWHEMPLGP